MNYIIENESLMVSVSTLGGELMSIKSKDNGIEYLWQGDKKYWGGRAPNMFPICGRLWDGKYTYLGKEYTMPNHGIARSSELALVDKKNDEITLSLVANEQTKEKYPFDFEYQINLKLVKNTLAVTYIVKNLDTKELIFAVGGHPAFNVPINNEGDFRNYFVQFEDECNALRVDFSKECFCTHNDKYYTQGGVKRINLDHSLFDDDAIFLYNTSKKITLGTSLNDHSVTLSFPKMKYVGLWHAPKTDAPYICIEPWSSIPATHGVVDDLLTKEQMNHLPSGYTYKNTYTITIQ